MILAIFKAMKRGWFYIVGLSFLTSCSSLEQSNYYTDDLYYNDEVTHNFNFSAILNNENVAVPEDAVVYFDESESRRLNPTFEDRLAAMEAEDNYVPKANESPAPNSSFSNPVNYPMVGLGISAGNSWYIRQPMMQPGFVSPYNTFNPYYNPYYFPSHSHGQMIHVGAGTSYIPNTNSNVVVETKPYRPNVSSSRYEADRLNRIVQPIRPNANNQSNSSTSKPGYNSNSSRKYRTGSGSSSGVWSNPGYHNSSRSSGSSGSSRSGSVQGVRRR